MELGNFSQSGRPTLKTRVSFERVFPTRVSQDSLDLQANPDPPARLDFLDTTDSLEKTDNRSAEIPVLVC